MFRKNSALLIRMGHAKVNIAPPMARTKWFRIIGVPLGNQTALYPKATSFDGRARMPPEVWTDLSIDLLNRSLTTIDAGLPDGNRCTEARDPGAIGMEGRLRTRPPRPKRRPARSSRRGEERRASPPRLHQPTDTQGGRGSLCTKDKQQKAMQREGRHENRLAPLPPISMAH